MSNKTGKNSNGLASVKEQPRASTIGAMHDAKILEFYYEDRKSMQWIADELKISIATVSKRLAIIRSQITKQMFTDGKAYLQDAVIELEYVKKEARLAWQRSIGEVTTREVTIDPEGETTEKTSTKIQAGNPQFLAEITKAVLAGLKVLGLDTKPEMTVTLPFEVLAMMQAMNVDMATFRAQIIKEVKDAYMEAHGEIIEPSKQFIELEATVKSDAGIEDGVIDE